MNTSSHIPHVAIIGGGFSGAALAWHLTRNSNRPKRITVFEPRPFLGAGLAYGATDPQHRVNVPATRMSIDTQQPDDFINWIKQTNALANDPAAYRPDGNVFPARSVFGRYIADRLAPFLHTGQVIHLRQQVASVYKRANEGWVITDGQGRTISADIVVIATSHPAPQPPKLLQDAYLGSAHRPVLVTNPWQPNALDSIGVSDRVLIVGTGLSMADAVVTLTACGHAGGITAVSRRGQRSRGHAAGSFSPVGQFISPPSRTALQLLRRIRYELAANPHLPWQALFDRIREQAPDIWAALSLAERKRLIRHVRPFWDTHRFRIAPQVEEVLHTRERAGTLEVLAGCLTDVQVERGRFVITIRRGATTVRHEAYDAIITTTGPAHDAIIHTVPFIHQLAAAGLVEMDATGLGLHVDAIGRACVGSRHENTLFVAGPLARGQFGELMGLPEVTRYAEKLAVTLDAVLASFPSLHHSEQEWATT